MKLVRKIVAATVLASLTACSTKAPSTVEIISTATPEQIISRDVYQHPKVVMRTNASEIQILARLARSMEELEALVRDAEISADPDARIRFDYYQLRADLLSITQGIQAHIHTPVYTPRSLDPIAGNYGR